MHAGEHWQVVAAGNGTNALLARAELADRWFATGLLDPAQGAWLEFASSRVWALAGRAGHMLCPLSQSKSPDSRTDAVAFAEAFHQSRAIDTASPLHDAIYVEHLARLLPTYDGREAISDDLVLGHWLSGGAHVSASNLEQLQKMMSWLPGDAIEDIVSRAGLDIMPVAGKGLNTQGALAKDANDAGSAPRAPFELIGRDVLTQFFQEHVIDIVENREQYARMGIDSPSGIVLFGPTGCGKTYAVERLVEYLGWPSYQIDASSVASPYIHETSRKVAEVFSKAIEHAPAVIIIDEMESFLASRDTAAGHHHVEEVAEFLRRIPDAVKNGVLVIGMTNMIDAIDPAILRRGRFDHLIAVEHANEVEVLHLMHKMAATLPVAPDVDLATMARALAGHPLSDVTFVVRESARLAVRAGHEALTQAELETALAVAKARTKQGSESNPIGFY
jgi:hypothetical protein